MIHRVSVQPQLVNPVRFGTGGKPAYPMVLAASLLAAAPAAKAIEPADLFFPKVEGMLVPGPMSKQCNIASTPLPNFDPLKKNPFVTITPQDAALAECVEASVRLAALKRELSKLPDFEEMMTYFGEHVQVGEALTITRAELFTALPIGENFNALVSNPPEGWQELIDKGLLKVEQSVDILPNGEVVPGAASTGGMVLLAFANDDSKKWYEFLKLKQAFTPDTYQNP